ncbi:hypothetical protein V5R04_04035 [Jonesiaceae bacterium BS-20]|uniref:Uncharacterized protein n=1 Tax=Jonesiaceae bacterium BS-20 TaxID=3120821 RepID=A0AAU7DZB2_9MICO
MTQLPNPAAQPGSTAQPQHQGHPRAPKKSQYSALITFLVGLDVLLIALAVVVGINTFAGPESPASQATAVTQGQAGSGQDGAGDLGEGDDALGSQPGADSTGIRLFASPSGNITCEISALGARCGIASLTQEPEENVGDCEGTIGKMVTLGAQGAELPCVAPQDGPFQSTSQYQLLDYGQDISVNNYHCVSERTGITCTDGSTNRGFTLAKAGIQTF